VVAILVTLVMAIVVTTLMVEAFTMVVAVTMVDGTMEAIGLCQLIHTIHVRQATSTTRTYTIRTCIHRTVSPLRHEQSNVVRIVA
jgi:hypothetical protein